MSLFIQCFTKLIDLNQIKRCDVTVLKRVFVQKDELDYQVSRPAWSIEPAVYSFHTINTPECEEVLLILNKLH